MDGVAGEATQTSIIRQTERDLGVRDGTESGESFKQIKKGPDAEGTRKKGEDFARKMEKMR